MAIIYVDTDKFHVISKERVVELEVSATVDRSLPALMDVGAYVVEEIQRELTGEITRASLAKLEIKDDPRKDRIGYTLRLLVIRPQA